MRELIEDLRKAQTVIEAQLKPWVQDKTVPLDERWEVFCKAGMGSTDEWSYDGFSFIDNDYFMYDGKYHCDRYQTVELADVIERALEETDVLEDEKGEPIVDDNDEFILCEGEQERLNKMKEQVLKDFIWSFTYDW